MNDEQIKSDPNISENQLELPPVEVTKDGLITTKLYDVKILTKIAAFGASFTKCATEQLKYISELSKVFIPEDGSEADKDKNYQVMLDMSCKLKDINDINSKMEYNEFTFRVQNNRTKNVMEITYNTKRKNVFSINFYSVANYGDARPGEMRQVYRNEDINIGNLEDTAKMLLDMFNEKEKAADVEKQVNDIPLDEL